ncbi:MAG TPA: exodeoxyribonuclease VII small subunit [Candidatus Sphingobacterium stercorigallinarum]|nr:exodeoxyribonuclease VII small subunit [Candidatus Sphingobacterium stercorigallinarum]
MNNKKTYSDAFDELQSIVSEIESGDIAVDELTQRIARASELLQVCKTKLSASEEEVEKLLARLDQDNEQEAEG